MNLLQSIQNQTMSSREIAKLTDKRHDHIIRDIREKIEPLIDSPDLGDDIKQGLTMVLDNRGYTKEYQLNKFVSEILVTGYDVERRAKVIKRFMELERKLQENLNHKATRQESKLEYRPMTNAIAEAHEEIKPYHFSNEADLINRIALGMTASKFRKHHDIEKTEAIRDYMTAEQLNCIISLQRANTVYIEDGLSFDDRKTKLTNLFDRKHKQKLINEIHLLES